MIKKYCQYVFVALLTFVLSLSGALAFEVALDDKDFGVNYIINKVDSNSDTAYVVGDYVFTANHKLTIQDVMLAAKSIKPSDASGKKDTDPIFGEMTIFQIRREKDGNGDVTNKWVVRNNFLGDSKLTDTSKINIRYVNYVPINEEYKVTFDFNDGKTDNLVKSVEKGKTVEQPAFTREHYDLDGWYKDGGADKFNFGTTINEALTLKAKWTGKTYTLTFSGDGISEQPQSGAYPFTPTKPQDDPTKEGYDFKGWFLKGTDTEYQFDEPLTGNTEVEGRFEIKKFDVEFYDEPNHLYEKRTVNWGTIVEPPKLTKRGYTLAGWKKDSEDFRFEEGIDENIKVTAEWAGVSYTVSFDGDDITEAEQKLTYPAQPTKPTPDPKRAGYGFAGWFIDDEEVDFGNTDYVEDVTITGKWNPGKYTIKFTCDDCTGLPENIQVTYPEHPTQPSKTPVKIGYDFKHWYKEGTDDNTAFNFDAEVSEDTTLKAKFEIKKFNVNFKACDPNDSKCVDSEVSKLPTTQVVEYNKQASNPTEQPEREGYEFMGWYLQRGPVVNQAPFEFDKTNIVNDITLVAKWQKKTYTVTFKLDEEVLDTINGVEHGTTVQQAIDKANPNLSPYKESHRFSHWYLEEGSDSTKYELTTPVTANITLKAKMIPLVDIDNIVSDMALKVETESFTVSKLGNTITIDVSKGDDSHSAAHNDDSIKTLVESGNTGIAKAIKEVVANENVQNVKMSYDNQDYEFTNDETEIKGKLKELLEAIATKNSSTYETATLNELIENNYSDNPLTLTITLKDTADTVEGQESPATYKVKVASSIITVTNETELKNAIRGNYESIKIGNNFDVNDPVMINRSVSIFGADASTTITLDKPEADTVLDIRYSGVGGTKTDVNIKDLTIKGTKKGINVPEASTSLSLMNVKFEDNSEMAMYIAGKVHADGELSYNKEDYNHPFIRTRRSNAITGGLASSSKTTGNIEVHSGYATYDYKIIVPFGGKKYTNDDFKKHTWETNAWVIGDEWCEGCTGADGNLKEEYQNLIGQNDTSSSDQLQGTDWAQYYLKEENSKYYTVIFRDTPSATLTVRYVLYNGDPVEPGEPLPWYTFKAYAKNRTLGKAEGQKTYELKGWSDDDKGKTKNYDLDIKNVTATKNYYTYYEELTGPMAASIKAMNWANTIIQK